MLEHVGAIHDIRVTVLEGEVRRGREPDLALSCKIRVLRTADETKFCCHLDDGGELSESDCQATV